MKFIAFCVGNNQNSGPKGSLTDCVNWASKKLGENNGIMEVNVCEITHKVERSASPVRVSALDEDGQFTHVGDHTANGGRAQMDNDF